MTFGAPDGSAGRGPRVRYGMIGAGLALAGCAEESGNFSQHPGFAAWYARNPPAEAAPPAADRALLVRFQPRFFLPEGHAGPIDFYADYIGAGTLYDPAGEVIADAVTPELLNRHEHRPLVTFVHRPEAAPARPTPVVYGRIDRDELELPGCARAIPITFLTYHLVFRVSGLPAGMSGWAEAALGLIGDLEDWHQLDHYTALTLALADGDPRSAPFAATFQHHNYLRTWLLDEAAAPGTLVLPADGRLRVDVAIRSNELYPHRPGRSERRAVRFLEPESAAYLVTGDDQPFAAADDITDPAVEIDPALRFLAPADAFYVFEGWLGERRLLPGRDGPPGADYNTLPAFKPKPVQLALFYWQEDDADYLPMLAEAFADGRPDEIELAPFAAR
ncbi:MAG TPA: hypothetical protein VFZ01_13600, partial [Geminicoccaceae bacterium]